MEKPEECNCCSSSDIQLSRFELDTTIGGGGKTRHNVEFWFCDLCSHTHTSSIYRYPNMQASNTEVMRALCFIGNLILKKMNPPLTDKPMSIEELHAKYMGRDINSILYELEQCKSQLARSK